MRASGALAVSLLVFLAIASRSAIGQVAGSGLVPFRKVALSGQAAPGAEPGSVFDLLRARGIDAQGRVLFRGTLSGPLVDGSNDTGLWLGSAAGLVPVALESAPAADVGSSTVYGDFDVYARYALSPDGAVSFANWVDGPGVSRTNDGTLFAGQLGALRMVARESQRAGDLSPDITYSEFDSDYLALPVNNGYTSFYSTFRGPGVTTANNSALFGGPLDNLRVIARQGSHAAGTPGGVNYYRFSTASFVESPAVNTAGDCVFFATLAGTGVTSGNDRGLWVGDADGLTLLARKGDQAPGMPTGVYYYNMCDPSINNAGQVAFYSILGGPGITSSNDDAIWVGTPGNLDLLARAGDPAPGTDTAFSSFYWTTSLNRNGEVAFMARLADGNASFWVGTAGNLHKVVARGDPRPDGSGTFRLQYIGFPLKFNGQGQLAFLDAYYNGPASLWATDPGGDLRLICRQGEPFEVAPGDTRVISLIRTYGGLGNETGYPTYFNDAGELLVGLAFTDGSGGVFVAVVPEPATLALLTLAGLAVLRRRR